MAFDSTVGGENANSYASVDEADAYHVERGNAAWAALATERKQQLLVIASDYMSEAYAAAWQGSRATAAQALDWPRSGVEAFGYEILASIIPPAVGRACAVLALKALAGPLAPDLGRVVSRQVVGPIETQYADYSPQNKRYLSVDRMLAPYMPTRNPYAARLERA